MPEGRNPRIRDVPLIFSHKENTDDRVLSHISPDFIHQIKYFTCNVAGRAKLTAKKKKGPPGLLVGVVGKLLY